VDAAGTWPFDQAPDVAALTSRFVLDDNLPILSAVHYSDDHSWAFSCGTTSAADDGRIISMREALKIDPTLAEVADLPPGWCAFRDYVGGAWIREPNDEEDSGDAHHNT
jgi:hypothetical protein